MLVILLNFLVLHQLLALLILEGILWILRGFPSFFCCPSPFGGDTLKLLAFARIPPASPRFFKALLLLEGFLCIMHRTSSIAFLPSVIRILCTFPSFSPALLFFKLCGPTAGLTLNHNRIRPCPPSLSPLISLQIPAIMVLSF